MHSEKFFKNIEIEVENLSNAYGLVANEIDKLEQNQEDKKATASAENVEFTMLLNSFRLLFQRTPVWADL